jgi:hypothetical protein
MPDANPVQPLYNLPATPYHQDNAAQYTRAIRVTGSLNNPLTLTGSYANNSGFMVSNTSSILIITTNGTTYNANAFHAPGMPHQVYSFGLSYVSASAGGEITVLYR